MRARSYVLATLASLGVIGVGVGAGVEGQILAHGSQSTTNTSGTGFTPAPEASTASATPSATASATATPSATASATPSAKASAKPTPSATPTQSGPKDGTYTGQSVATQYGNVQVAVKVSGGKITSAQAIQYPNGSGRDQQINSYAVPILNSEVVKAQSANISQVSGATFTSGGYISSLQSAIEQIK